MASEWTILVYMAADNGLSDYAIQDINEMESAQCPVGTQVIIQADFYQTSYLSGAYRYKLVQDNSAEITSPVLANLGEIDSGDYRSLKSFIQWGFAHYPAPKKALIIWSHGDSWYKGNENKWICPDNDAENIMSVADGDLRAALAGSPALDILLFDACSMQTIEVLSEVAAFAGNVIGSEDFVPVTGFPYQDILPIWQGTAESIAEQIPELYVNSYAAYGSQNPYGSAQRSSCSAILTDKLDDFQAALHEFCFQMRPTAAMIRDERQYCYNLNTNDAEVDLEEFITRVQRMQGIEAGSADTLALIWRNCILSKSAIDYDVDIGSATIWFPYYQTIYENWWEHYAGLNFYQSGWLAFLNAAYDEDIIAPGKSQNLNARITGQPIAGYELAVSWQVLPDPDPLGYFLSFHPDALEQPWIEQHIANQEEYQEHCQTTISIISPGWLSLQLEDLSGNRGETDSLYVSLSQSQDLCYIAPSPVKRGSLVNLHYTVGKLITDNYRILIYDITGKRVKEYTGQFKNLETANKAKTTGTIPLGSMDDLAPGVFIAVLADGGNNPKCKFAVVN